METLKKQSHLRIDKCFPHLFFFVPSIHVNDHSVLFASIISGSQANFSILNFSKG